MHLKVLKNITRHTANTFTNQFTLRMKNKFRTLLGCMTLMLFALCFTVPAQAEDNSPPQALEQCDQLTLDYATFEVLQLSAPVSVLSPQSNVEVPGDVGYDATGNFQADWPPGSITAQAIKYERKTLPGLQALFDYIQCLEEERQAAQPYAGQMRFGTDIDRWCSLNQNFIYRALPVPFAHSGQINQTTRHVLMC